jgi:hypothetical protein
VYAVYFDRQVTHPSELLSPLWMFITEIESSLFNKIVACKDPQRLQKEILAVLFALCDQ